MPLLHDLGTRLYHVGIRAAAPFMSKAREWVDGRRRLWKRLEERREALHGCVWMHCASVGEFEQGRPVLEALMAKRPDVPVLITFFSPSGMRAHGAKGLAFPGHRAPVHVDYLPADGAQAAERFVALLSPSAVLWVKYEFWHHHLRAVQRGGVPLFLLSAIFRPGQPFFRWYGRTWRAMLRRFDWIFTQDEASLGLLRDIGITNASVSGDTRFDRVMAIVKAQEELPTAKAFRGEGPVLICGSTWPADEALLEKAIAGLVTAPKCLVAPHEPGEAHLKAIEQSFPRPLARWSELEGATAANIAHVLGPERGSTLLVDRVGLLSRLYRYGDVAFVGGGFGEGVHSLLEPAGWGLPVIFGPRHTKFAEARGLIEAGGGFEVRDADALRTLLQHLFTDPIARHKAGEAAAAYVRARCGATRRVVEALGERL